MIDPASEMRGWLASRPTDMRRGFDGLALSVLETLHRDPTAAIFPCHAARAVDRSRSYGTTARCGASTGYSRLDRER